MDLTIREQAHAALVAVAIVVAALVQGFLRRARAPRRRSDLGDRDRRPGQPRAPHRAGRQDGGCGQGEPRRGGGDRPCLDGVGERPGPSLRGGGSRLCLSRAVHAGGMPPAPAAAGSGLRLTVGLGAVSILALVSYAARPSRQRGAGAADPERRRTALLSDRVLERRGRPARRRDPARLRGGASRRWQRSLATAVIPIALLGIWLTSSRGGAAAAVIGIVVLVAATGGRSRLLLGIMIGAAAGRRADRRR